MFTRQLNVFLMFTSIALFSSPQLYAQDDKNNTHVSSSEVEASIEDSFDFTLRLGEGGFRDSRSPLGKLGGGQLALDIKPRNLPVAVSISGEYYTNSANPTHIYEISDLLAVNILYIAPLLDFEKTEYFVGGGIGQLKVPYDDFIPGRSVDSHLYNLEAGIHMKTFKRIGFYAVAKYLRADKTVNNIKVVDFNETIIIVGITVNFSY